MMRSFWMTVASNIAVDSRLAFAMPPALNRGPRLHDVHDATLRIRVRGNFKAVGAAVESMLLAATRKRFVSARLPA